MFTNAVMLTNLLYLIKQNRNSFINIGDNFINISDTFFNINY